MIVSFTTLLIITSAAGSAHVAAFADPLHCNTYIECYQIGYGHGYSDDKNNISPAYKCLGHSQAYCNGYSSGFRNAYGSNIYSGNPNSGAINWMNLCNSVSVALLKPCSTLVGPDHYHLTPPGQHAACEQKDILLPPSFCSLVVS
jgi:hypothetical protein